MKKAWIILIISAITDFIINAGTSMGAAMIATGKTTMPDNAVLILCMLGGIVAAARTVQQALKGGPETSIALMGGESIVKTETIEKTP